MKRFFIRCAVLLAISCLALGGPVSGGASTAKSPTHAQTVRCSTAAKGRANATKADISACMALDPIRSVRCPKGPTVIVVKVTNVLYALRQGHKSVKLGSVTRLDRTSNLCGGPVTPSTIAPPTATGTASTAAASGIRIGPGPQATYAVQPQPPPGSCHYSRIAVYPLPDRHCTPGAVNPLVTQANIGSTICRARYTATIRPPESVTEAEKKASAAAYDYTGSLHTAEYDHLISLELGGDPNDPANLWIEPNDKPSAKSTSNTKDALENKLHDLVCSGQVSLSVAQRAIATNWVAAYQMYDASAPPTPITATTMVTAPAPAPAPASPSPVPTSPASAGCYPKTDGGNCYEPSEYCRNSDHGTTGVAGDGKSITCEDDSGWRWEPT